MSYEKRALFEVELIEKVDAPTGLPGDDWHHYVIGQGTAKIEGFRSGTLKAVTQHTEDYCGELNERNNKSNSPYSPRSTQKTNK